MTSKTQSSRESANHVHITGPTYLTILRMLLSVVFMVFALLPYHWASIVALVIFIAAAITDKIDGIWARKSKKVTDLGTFLDPLADKMLVDLAFLVLVYINMAPIWVFAIIIVRDLAVDGMRMMAARNKVTIAASFLGKLKTTVQMTALITLLAAIVLQNNVIHILGLVSLYLALVLTIISGVGYLTKGYRKFIK
ncbi:CDP-diacylglycerol--glycerol-3-phosphate 3-phosphatidyltransferase [Candidatus Saccharibacteria bacterium]|nr:CDP-diacylglycerol--glycerol-3-phosphate 3-phosphatidyltransferase [Candidatus Saccharibacteria bacterium]